GVHRVDRDPLVPAVHAAVPEPTTPPHRRAQESSFRGVLDEASASDPLPARPHVFGHNGWLVAATTERSIHFVTNAPRADERTERRMRVPGQTPSHPVWHVLLIREPGLRGDGSLRRLNGDTGEYER